MPLKRPFATALGVKTATTNVLLELRLQGGTTARAEASSSIVMAKHSPKDLAKALQEMLKEFRGRDVRALAPLTKDIWRGWGAWPAAAAAFESAAVAALAARHRMRLCDYFGGAREAIETDVTLSAASPAETAEAAAAWARAGFKTLKVKVGRGGPKADLERVLAAHRAGRRSRIALDGNQKLGQAGALRLVEACLKRGVRVVLLEQPVRRADLKGLRAVKRRSPVPVAADESVRTVLDARRILDLDAADLLNLKVAKTGLGACRQIIALTQAAGKELMLGCMQESLLGLTASVHLACGTGAFAHHDLDSDLLLAGKQPKGKCRRRGAVLTP